MNKKCKITIVFLFLLLFVGILICKITGLINNMEYGLITFVLSAFFGVISIIESFFKKNIVLTILFLFVFTYTYSFRYFYIDSAWISFHQVEVGSVETMNNLINISFIFNMTLWYFIKIPRINIDYERSKVNYYDNNILFILNLLVFILMSVYGNTNEFVFVSGGYNQTHGTGNRNSLTEYAIIFLIAAFIFSGKNNNKLRLLYLFSLMYILKNLLQGGRIETVMVLFVLLIFDIRYRFSYNKIILGSIIAYSFLSIFSFYRDNPSNFLLYNDLGSMLTSSSKIFPNGSISTNQGDVLFASERMFILINEGSLDIYNRIKSLFYFVIASFLPYSILPPIANLSTYKTDVYNVGGGGLAYAYFFVYLSYLGLFLLSYIVKKGLNSFSFKNTNSFSFFYGMLVIITLPRWYAYYPIFLIKFCVIGALYIYIITRFHIKYGAKVNVLLKK